MNRLLLLLILVLGTTVNAQWKEHERKDEFGDPTGDVIEMIILNGEFSNSATSGDRATGALVRTKDLIGFSLKDYGGATNTYYNHKFTIHVKKVNGEKYKINAGVDSYNGREYKTRKWVYLKNQKKLEKPDKWSEKKWNKHVAKYNLNGILGELQIGFDVLSNLEFGDVLVIKENASTYRFIIQ